VSGIVLEGRPHRSTLPCWCGWRPPARCRSLPVQVLLMPNGSACSPPPPDLAQREATRV